MHTKAIIFITQVLLLAMMAIFISELEQLFLTVNQFFHHLSRLLIQETTLGKSIPTEQLFAMDLMS
jgi:hypothetical protein